MQIADYVTMDRMRDQVPGVLRDLGELELANAFREAMRHPDGVVAGLGDRLVDVATVLERAAVDPDADVNGPVVINVATALRVLAGGEARQGEPLDWKPTGRDCWSTVDSRGTAYFVSPGMFGWGVTISSWDRPDWHAASPDQAKVLAEEISARPKFSREAMVEERLHMD